MEFISAALSITYFVMTIKGIILGAFLQQRIRNHSRLIPNNRSFLRQNPVTPVFAADESS